MIGYIFNCSATKNLEEVEPSKSSPAIPLSRTNVYQGVTNSSVIIYNTGTAWRVDTAASATVQTSGTYTVGAGNQQFIEADTNKKDNVTDVETWTPRTGSDVLIVNPNNLIPYAQTGKNTVGVLFNTVGFLIFIDGSPSLLSKDT